MLLFITVVSLAIAVVMTVVAWRLVREEERRSDARVSALSADIYGEDDAAPVAVNDLFDPDARPRTKASLIHALGVGVLVVGTLMALAVVFTGGPSTRPDVSAVHEDSGRAAVAPAQSGPPIELTALAHDRDRDGLTVRGVVRNPADGASIGPLVAAVSVFNRAGELVATARAPVERPELEAGVESKFLVRIAGVGDVYRYRVSFTVDNRTVGHVDRRDHAVTAQLP